VHTTQSADCATPIRVSCESAIQRGITEIAFTDHIEHELADMSYGFFDYPTYMAAIEDARDRYGDQLVILSGAEVDFNTRIANDVEAFLGSHEFDFVIGSVHYGDLGEIIFPEYFVERSIEDVLLAYLEQIHAAVETGWFDTIGHIDLPKRYAPSAAGEYVPQRYVAELSDVFRSMIDRGLTFEINTSGLRQAPKTSMPGPQIVALYTALGGAAVTIGSDSHVPETIGADFDRTMSMLKLMGIQEISTFRQRHRANVPIHRVIRSANTRNVEHGIPNA
ncbi:MAG: histidinol-phosphatase HisJ family protein, partial [Chloroflexota bacterium]|nr:histidinol-phosphatase HisJ family protein [Chloroflexota bacterium]